jgi:hypothetical protein
MTRDAQKTAELRFVEKAAEFLGRQWTIGDAERETPDFVVTEGDRRFGLEVTEVFTGEKQDSGSPTKKSERRIQRTINELRKQYEARAGVRLDVRINNLNHADMAPIIPALLAMDFASKPEGHEFVRIDLGNGLILRARKFSRGDWITVDDRVGWVTFDSLPIISEQIRQKALKLPSYQSAVGDDVRLLMVANRLMNSGKIVLEGTHDPQMHGFRAVYFLSYPETVRVFGDG